MKQTADLKVFISTRESTCDECGEDLGRKAWIMLVKEKGALCLSCAHIRHNETSYDELLSRGHDRWEAREHVSESVENVLSKWKVSYQS